MSDQRGQGREPDLDALLDEALEGFGVQQAGEEPGAGPATSSAPDAPSSSRQPSGAALPSAANRGSAGVAGKGLRFDPLGQRPPKASASPGCGGGGGGAARTARAGPTPVGPSAAPPPPPAGSASPPEEEDLSAGLSRLLAELARVDEVGAASGGDPADGAQLAGTLRALAEQLPDFAAAGGPGGPADEEELLSRLAEQMAGALPGGAAGAGAGGEPGPGVSALVDSLMQQLLSKDVLYQPMKDIGARYPAWLAANRGALPPEEAARYERQQHYIGRILAVYESDDPGNFSELVVLLQEMQACGQPPQEIVDELAPGAAAGAFGGGGGDLPADLASCPVQ